MPTLVVPFKMPRYLTLFFPRRISRCAEKIEQEIGKEHGSLATILQLLERYVQNCEVGSSIGLTSNISMRSASSRALLRNVEAALETHVADKLWSSHLKTNTKFRSDLRQVRLAHSHRTGNMARADQSHSSETVETPKPRTVAS